MKKLILFLFISVGLNAQFNYQAIVKDSDGNPVTNNQVKFKFSMMYQSSTATPVYVEEHDLITPPDGVVNLSVGGGTVVNGTFSNIDWSQSVFMKEELDTGSGYQDMGTRQIASVPVAEYAKRVAVSDNFSELDLSGIANIKTYKGRAFQTNIVTQTSIFTVSYNEVYEQPNWIEYQVRNVTANVQRSGDFYGVDGIYTSHEDDYHSNDWDKGHLAPAASFLDSQENLEATFSYLNCALMKDNLNRYEWAQLEGQVRDWASGLGVDIDVRVDLFFDENHTVLNTGAHVPSRFLKTITLPTGVTFPNETISKKCFEFPNADTNGVDWTDFEVDCSSVNSSTSSTTSSSTNIELTDSVNSTVINQLMNKLDWMGFFVPFGVNDSGFVQSMMGGTDLAIQGGFTLLYDLTTNRINIPDLANYSSPPDEQYRIEDENGVKVELTKEDRLNENNQVIGLNWVGSIPQGASKVRFLYKYSSSPPQLFTTPYIELKHGYDKFFANYSGETSYYNSNISISGGTSSTTTATSTTTTSTTESSTCSITYNDISNMSDGRNYSVVLGEEMMRIEFEFETDCEGDKSVSNIEGLPEGWDSSASFELVRIGGTTNVATGTYNWSLTAYAGTNSFTLEGVLTITSSSTTSTTESNCLPYLYSEIGDYSITAGLEHPNSYNSGLIGQVRIPSGCDGNLIIQQIEKINVNGYESNPDYFTIDSNTLSSLPDGLGFEWDDAMTWYQIYGTSAENSAGTYSFTVTITLTDSSTLTDSFTITVTDSSTNSNTNPVSVIYKTTQSDYPIFEKEGYYFNNTICQGTESMYFFISPDEKGDSEVQWMLDPPSAGSVDVDPNHFPNTSIITLDPLFSGTASLSVRLAGVGDPTDWLTVPLNIVEETVPPESPTQLITPFGDVPLTSPTESTSNTTFFTRSNADYNDYGALEWQITNVTPTGNVTSTGSITVDTGILDWQPGFTGSFDIGVRPISCSDGSFGDWVGSTYSISSTSSSTTSSTESSTASLIYFENGSCKCPNASVGDTATISGTVYTVVDNSSIYSTINNDNVNLCTTLVTDMSQLFSYKSNFNSIIDFWDTSNVTNMAVMFIGGTAFNQDISKWDTSSVTNMSYMFSEASAFNQDIGNWDTSSVTDMNSMFRDASAFNQNLIEWCVPNFQNQPTDFSTNSSMNYLNLPQWGTCPSYHSIDVTATSNSDYTLSGTDRTGNVSGNDPNLTFNVGDTINFNVDTSNHPFYIQTAQGTGGENQASGVNNGGATSGLVSWTPTEAGTYYYQCSFHSEMVGTITVNN